MQDDSNNLENLVIEHIFNAPAEKLWQMWTQENFVQQWWGVDGFTNILAKMNVRVGGVSHVGMRASKDYGGRDYYNTFRYTQVVPNKLIEYISNFADKDGNDIAPVEAGMPQETPMNKKQRIEFQYLDDSTTKVIITEFGWQKSGEMIVRSRQGLEQTLRNIERVLSDQ